MWNREPTAHVALRYCLKVITRHVAFLLSNSTKRNCTPDSFTLSDRCFSLLVVTSSTLSLLLYLAGKHRKTTIRH